MCSSDLEAAILARGHPVVLVDHAGSLGGLAHGVADVEAFDTQACRVFQRQPQHVKQVLGTTQLRTVDGQVAGERNLRVGMGLRKPPTPVLLRILHPGNSMARIV